MAYREMARRALMAAVLLQACGGGSGPGGAIEPGGSATVEGVVRDLAANAPIAGATVSAGGVQTTSRTDGRFSLTGVPAGPSVTIEANAAGFERHTAAIEVREGVNTHDIRLARLSLFELQDFAAYIPPTVGDIRGAIVFIQGERGVDTRAYATGVFDDPDPAINQARRDLRNGLLSIAGDYGLAIVGMAPLPDGPDMYARVLAALEEVATRSGRSDLAEAPILPIGVSAGGRPAYGITLWRPERMIALMMVIPLMPTTERSAAAQRVPGYMILAERDLQVGTEEQIELFEANRAEGAIWGLAIEPGAGHTALSPSARNVMLQWLRTVLELRLPPPGASGGLRPLQESSGWLGDRTTFDVAAYGDYAGDPRQASWLPTEDVARTWRDFVMGRVELMRR